MFWIRKYDDNIATFVTRQLENGTMDKASVQSGIQLLMNIIYESAHDYRLTFSLPTMVVVSLILMKRQCLRQISLIEINTEVTL